MDASETKSFVQTHKDSTSDPSWRTAVLQKLQDNKETLGILLRVEDLVYASQFMERPTDVPDTSEILDSETEQMITTAASRLNQKVRDSITSGLYKVRTSEVVGYLPLDERALAGLQLNVLYVLLGLQTVPEFEQTMRSHPVLSADEGAEFAQEIRRTLFAELALYLEGMGDTAPTSSETLSAALERSPDVQARLAKLPESVQAVVSSQQVESAFASIQKRHHVEAATAKALAEQVIRVMVGLSNMNDFKVSVTRVAGIPPSGLDALFLDVEQGLFKPVRTAILGALQKNMGSLPTKEGSQPNDPYHTPAR